jgi:hypothetical protein
MIDDASDDLDAVLDNWIDHDRWQKPNHYSNNSRRMPS